MTDVGGVLWVENPHQPLATPGLVSAEEIWSTQGPSEGDIWEAPRRIRVGNGIVYLMDRQASKIHRVTLGGEPLSPLGEPGQGPGQYRRLVDALPLPEGLFVVDGGNGRVDVLDQEGSLMTSAPLGQYVFSAVPLGEDAIAVSGVLGRERGWQLIDSRGTVAPFEFPELEAPEGTEPPPNQGATWGHRLVRWEYTVPRIWIYTSSGALERVIHIPFPPEEATDAELNTMAQEVGAVLAEDGVPAPVIHQEMERLKARLRIKSRFRGIQFDDGSGLVALLEQEPEDFGAGPATLHLLSLEGIYLAALSFHQPWADFDLKDGVLYVLARDPVTDLVTLHVYSVTVPEDLLERARELAWTDPPP